MEQISKQGIRNYGKGLALIIILLVIWEGLALLIGNNYILPRLGEIFSVLLQPAAPVLGGESLLENTWVSLREVLTGFLCAAALAIPLGLLLGWSQEIRLWLNPTIQILRPVPPIAWMPFAIAWFGIGINSVLFIIAMGAFFPILINTVDGVQGVRQRWIEVAVMFHATTAEKLRTVILPGTTAGLGFLIMYAYNLGQLQVIGAGMIVIGIIGLGADVLFRAGQVRFFAWQGKD